MGLWIDLTSDGAGRLAGSPVTAEPLAPTESDAQPDAERGVWIRFFAGKAGEQACFIPVAGANRLSRLLLAPGSEAPANDEEELSADGKESLVQFFQQIAMMIPAADWLGFDGEMIGSEVERIEWAPAGIARFRFSTSEGPLFDLQLLLSADFSSALRIPEEISKPSGASQPKPFSRPQASPAGSRDVNLELLMDVELDVTLRFGQREMLLGDVLNLAPGSVVELDQQVQDPVQLLVADKVVAWGEVVVVDGNYGLRVIGLASREERIESLRN